MIDHLLTSFQACGTGLYAHPVVEAVLGDLHPGDEALTLRMATEADLGPGDHVLDVGCGKGTSLIALARRIGCRVTGADVEQANVDEAQRRMQAAGVDGQVLRFDGDVDSLPTGFTAVLSECTLCLQGDSGATLDALRRRLVPGGTLLLSDVTVEEQAEAFREAAGIAACLGGALPRRQLRGLVAQRFDIVESWDDPASIAAVRQRIHERVDVAAIVEAAEALGHDSVPRLVASAESAFAAGHLSYAAIVARAPQAI